MFKVGRGKKEITYFKKGLGMLGFGMAHHRMMDIKTPLFARALTITNSEQGKKWCLVNCELAFITFSLQQEVLTLLSEQYPQWGYTEENLLLTAQHTHSGPAGFSYYHFYNITSDGFHPDVLDFLSRGIVGAIEAAENNTIEADLYFGKEEFGQEDEVAFNRSPLAYNQNPDISEKITRETTWKGTNRWMKLLGIRDKNGREVASANWFGTHTTSISNDQKSICGDNKGYAARILENAFDEDYVGIFAQGICGDVSPKFRYNPRHAFQRGPWEGKFPDDFKSAEYNGNLQSKKAKSIIEFSKYNTLNNNILYCFNWINFSSIRVSKKYTGSGQDESTSSAVMGNSFFIGSLQDGPGAPPFLGTIVDQLLKLLKKRDMKRARSTSADALIETIQYYAIQHPKLMMAETGKKRFMGLFNLNLMPIPAFIDQNVAQLKHFYKKTKSLTTPWTPQILPLQVVCCGSLAWIAFPFEITVIAGKRLENSCLELLKAQGIEEVILCPYANGYAGYITTPEEYNVQQYEGGHTVFGKWTLPAIQTAFDWMIRQHIIKENQNHPNWVVERPPYDKEHMEAFRAKS